MGAAGGLIVARTAQSTPVGSWRVRRTSIKPAPNDSLEASPPFFLVDGGGLQLYEGMKELT